MATTTKRKSTSHSKSRKRRKQKQATGRFYLFIGLIALIVVGLIVGIPKLTGKGAKTVSDTAGAGDAVQQQSQSGDGETKSIAQLIEEDSDLEALSGSEKVQVASDLNVNKDLPDNWYNILLLGTDSRKKTGVSRTDTMIICSINKDEGRIKLCSIMRDMMVDIPGHGTKKINSCTYYGGPELLMQVVNEKLHMNITDYVMVNFYSFQHVIDLIGGIEMDITEKEMVEINKGVGEAAQTSGMAKEDYNRSELELKNFGAGIHLDGIQALGYARIRHIDSDYQRTERQRNVINAALQKVKTMNLSLTDCLKIGKDVFEYATTNISLTNAASIAFTVLSNGIGEMESARMPGKETFVSEVRNGTSALYDIDWEANAKLLYSWIYEK